MPMPQPAAAAASSTAASNTAQSANTLEPSLLSSTNAPSSVPSVNPDLNLKYDPCNEVHKAISKGATETVKREAINTCGLPSSEQKRAFMHKGLDDATRTSMIDQRKLQAYFHLMIH
jgi:hypothetical protein